MSEVRYFAYGSNLDADQMRERCPSSRGIERARLDDHRLDFTHFSRRWQAGAADVVPARGRVVWGVLYELHGDDLARLDGFEGGYERIDVRVTAASGVLHAATTYSVRDKGTHAPCEAYLAKMLHWGERWALPEDYLAELRASAADPSRSTPERSRSK